MEKNLNNMTAEMENEEVTQVCNEINDLGLDLNMDKKDYNKISKE